MALRNKKQEERYGNGFYVAFRRGAKRYVCMSEKHYQNYGNEYERGKFYHDYMEAALETDRLNEGESFEVPETKVILVNKSTEESNELSPETKQEMKVEPKEEVLVESSGNTAKRKITFDKRGK